MTDPGQSRLPDWLKLVGVAVVGAVLALIGWSIADSFQLAPATAAPAVTTTTMSLAVTTTTTVVAIGATDETAPSTTAVVRVPTQLELSEVQVDLGDGTSAVMIEVVNAGEGVASWAIESDALGLVVVPSNGDLAAGARVTIEISLDVAQVPEGEYSAEFVLSWADGSVEATIAAVTADNPVIHNPKASPAAVKVQDPANCSPTRTTVTARVRDTSEIEQVLVRWSDGGSNIETAMTPAGNEMFEARVGPFQNVGAASVKVVAFDVHGNAGGATIPVMVEACP